MSSEHTTSQRAPRNWWGPLWPIGEALRFLTIIPVPGLPPMTESFFAHRSRLSGCRAGARRVARRDWLDHWGALERNGARGCAGGRLGCVDGGTAP